MTHQDPLPRVQARLQQLLQRYQSAAPDRLAVKAELDALNEALDTLDEPVVRIAVFGLVSRGKSAVINALLGKKLLKTGPTHGVTQWPRSVYWSPTDDLRVELVDTPGLGEVKGTERANMARTTLEQADLVLFVVAGELNHTEYAALQDLWQQGKPVLLVFNKVDQYPDQDQQRIAQSLRVRAPEVTQPPQDLGQSPDEASADEAPAAPKQGKAPQPQQDKAPSSELALRPDEIVLVAADPAPQQVQVESPDGRVTREWETPPVQIEPLRQRLLEILAQDGSTLIALRALRQAQGAEAAIAQRSIWRYKEQADDLIWTFAQWKSVVVALNPVAGLDLAGGAIADLIMIRALARLYQLPMTSHGAQDLWNAIVWSSGSLLVGELGSGLVLGFGKSATAAVTALTGGLAGLGAYASTAAAQGALAGYGSYRVGKAAQWYLEQGCTWGPEGIDTAIQEIFSQIDRGSILARLRQKLPER
ncbi:MAG: DUF697 domain-containing protein [Cyanobacteria bacterium P01_A01_bin.135]